MVALTSLLLLLFATDIMSFTKFLSRKFSSNSCRMSNFRLRSQKTAPKKFSAFPFQYHEELIVTIEDVTNLGLGVARAKIADGQSWVVMVPLVLPGETVKVSIHRNNKNYSEADLVEVLEPSQDRVMPLCKYFSECGGCQYQHMSIDAQRMWKREQVSSLLEKIGGIENVEVDQAIGTSDHLYGYRAKLTPHYNAPRSSNDLKVGFQKRGTRIIVDIDKCVIATPDINNKYANIRSTLNEAVKLKLPKNGATLLFRECDEGIITDQRASVSHTLGDIKFYFKAGEFFQNNYHVLPLLVDYVVQVAQGDGCNRLIDAYCGSGLFALSASKYFESVSGVEVSEIAVNAAIETAKLNGITNSEFLCGSSENIFSKVSHLPADQTVIILDPPRKGCDEVFLNQLVSFRPKKIVYVSCDPATQARDAKFVVSNGYSIQKVQPFDLFPQTRHIENVITFIRNGAEL